MILSRSVAESNSYKWNLYSSKMFAHNLNFTYVLNEILQV
jgi:hypothetical protein